MSSVIGVAMPEGFASRVESLPAMPEAAQRSLELIDRADTTAAQLQSVIETDPALAASVLRLANSSLFPQSKPTTTLSHAIVMIGFQRLRALTMTSVIAGLRSGIPKLGWGARDHIWKHSVDVALAARSLGERSGLESCEEAFVAGLMHDCGRLILLMLEPESYVNLVGRHGGRLPTPDEERCHFGVGHEEAGAALTRRWRLAPQLVMAVGSHHGSHTFEGPHGAIAALVALADRIVDPSPGDDLDAAADALGFDHAEIEAVEEQLAHDLAKARAELLAIPLMA